MKFKYPLMLFLLSLLFVPLQALSYNPYPTGSSLNPIQVEIVPDFFGSLSSLRQQYGSVGYSRCYGLGCEGRDLADPIGQKDCLAYMNYCLQSVKSVAPTCQTGYELSANKTSCTKIVTTVISPDQVCVNKYGAYSKYAGYLNSNGGYVCGCQSGYDFNTDKTSCIKIEQVASEELCKQKYGELAINTVYGCGCPPTAPINADMTACVKIETPAAPTSPSVETINKQIKSSAPAESKEVKNISTNSTSQSEQDIAATNSFRLPPPTVDNRSIVRIIFDTLGALFKSLFGFR